jgi:hypothetical protein
MKYICLEYIEAGRVEGMTDEERNAMLDECLEHNDHLRATTSALAQSRRSRYKTCCPSRHLFR